MAWESGKNNMKKSFKVLILLAVFIFGGALGIHHSVFAEDPGEYSQTKEEESKSTLKKNKKLCDDEKIKEEYKKAVGCEDKKDARKLGVDAMRWVLGIITFIAVFTIATAGQRYVTSEGDAGRIKQARMMLLYGIIGLVIAFSAFFIVNFITSQLKL